jgi:hypothetical protein
MEITVLGLARLCVIGLLAATAILGERSSASARTPTVAIQLNRGGFIIGVSRGSGTLTFRGRRYPLSIGGVSLGATVGISRAWLVGNAYNLHRASDIEGAYSAVQAGLSIAGGHNTARLRNSRGVVLELSGRQRGFIFSVDLSGMQISLGR